MDLDDGGLDSGEDLAQAVVGGDFDLAGEVQDPVSADGFLCELLESRFSIEESGGCGIGDAHFGGIASGDLCVVVTGDGEVISADLDGFDFFRLHLVAEVDSRLNGRVGVAAGGVGLGIALHDGVGAVQEDGFELYVVSSGHHFEEAAASEGIGMAFEAGFSELEGGEGEKGSLGHVVGLELAAVVQDLEHAACGDAGGGEGLESLFFIKTEHVGGCQRGAQGPAGAGGVIAHGLVAGLDGDSHGVGGFVARDGGSEHLFHPDPVSLGEGNEKGENGASEVDDAAVGAVVEVERVAVEAVQEDGFFEDQVPGGSDRPEFSFFRHGKVEIAVQFFLLELRAGTGDGQIVQKAPLRSFHDLCGYRGIPDCVYCFQKFYRFIHLIPPGFESILSDIPAFYTCFLCLFSMHAIPGAMV